MQSIVIVGATSGLGYEVAKRFIEIGYRVGVAGRRTELLESLKAIAPEKVVIGKIDVTEQNAATHLTELIERTGNVETIFLSSGIGFQNRELAPEIELKITSTNGMGFVRMITTAFNYLKNRGGGHIAAITSVAGSRGIGVAAAYSATKAFQTQYINALEQLSCSHKLNITFTDIRPGFVATALLNDNNNYPMLMKPDYAGKVIFNAITKHKRVAIFDWRYKIVVALMKYSPRFIWKRIKL